MFQLTAYVLDHQHRHTGAVRVPGILRAPSIPALIGTLLTENGLEWREFKYEFEQADDEQSTPEEFVGSILGLTPLTDVLCVLSHETKINYPHCASRDHHRSCSVLCVGRGENGGCVHGGNPDLFHRCRAVGGVHLDGTVNSVSSSYGVVCINVNIFRGCPNLAYVHICTKEDCIIKDGETVQAIGVKTDTDEMIAYMITPRGFCTGCTRTKTMDANMIGGRGHEPMSTGSCQTCKNRIDHV